MAYRAPRPLELSPTPLDDDAVLQTNTNGPLHGFYKRNQGLFIVATSQLFFSLMNLCVKLLTVLEKPISTFELVIFRMAITYVCCQVYMFASGVPNPIYGPKGIRMWLVIRGVVGFVSLFGMYYSLKYMSLSDATVLSFLSPIVTTALGFMFLGEAVSWKQTVAGSSLLGVILIAKPTFLFGGSEHTDVGAGAGGPQITEAQHIKAIGIALLGVLGSAGAYTSIRVIGKRAHPMHTLSYFSLSCVSFATIGMFATHAEWVLPTRWAWLGILLLIGLFGFLAQLLLTLGLQRETASRGSLAMYVQIVFSLVFERVAFGASPSSMSVAGMCIIVASAIYIALNKPGSGNAEPGNTESTAMWDLAPEVEEGRGLLDGDKRKEELEQPDGVEKPIGSIGPASAEDINQRTH